MFAGCLLKSRRTREATGSLLPKIIHVDNCEGDDPSEDVMFYALAPNAYHITHEAKKSPRSSHHIVRG